MRCTACNEDYSKEQLGGGGGGAGRREEKAIRLGESILAGYGQVALAWAREAVAHQKLFAYI